jgi:hypothetical protein
MTRIASKFGIAAALTLVCVSAAAAQVRPTTTSTVSKGEVAKVDTVTVYKTDTVRTTLYRTDTLRLTGATVTRFDTVTVTEMPGWLNLPGGMYFGLGAGAFYPSAGIGQGQIPGYAMQANLGIDPVGSPLGFRITTGIARPDEAQPYGAMGPRPTLWNTTADLKLRLPSIGGSSFPQIGFYGVGGLAYIRKNGVREQSTQGPTGSDVIIEPGSSSVFGYTFGGGSTVNLGHSKELFLEARVINWNRSGFEGVHQFPLILGINWY